MAVEKGSAFLLKIGNGAATPVYSTIAGLRTTQLSINGDAVNVTNKDSGGWRELLNGAGVRSISVAAAGIFTGSAAETRAQSNALAGLIDALRKMARATTDDELVDWAMAQGDLWPSICRLVGITEAR